MVKLEVIKELAEQAEDYAYSAVIGGRECMEAYTEKFAELIVRECAEVCFRIDREYEGEDVLATWCADAILKHFGVEE